MSGTATSLDDEIEARERTLASLAQENEQLRKALRSLCDAVGNMRVPQTIADAGLQLTVTIGPALEHARRALTEPTP